MRIWVDAETGTWGSAEALYVFDLDDEKWTDFSELTDHDRIVAASLVGVKVVNEDD